MPNWKKVIVSGSDATLNSLNVVSGSTISGSIRTTGSLTVIGSESITGSFAVSGAAGTTVFSANADTLVFSGSLYTSGSISATGSLSVNGGITGSLLGTASYAITASYAMNGGGGGGTGVIYVLDEGTYQNSASYFDFVGAGVTATVSNGTASINIPGGSSTGIVGQNAVLSQSVAATTWSFTHNLGTQFPVFTVFDSNNNVIIPQQIYAQNTSSALIYFSTARSGTAVAALGGGIISSSYALVAVSASYASNSGLLNNTGSRTFATTGSNIFVGNQTVTGSLFTTGSNTLVGSTSLTGSLVISGSETITGYIQYMPVSTNIDNSVSASYIYVSGSTQDLYFTQNGSGYSNTTRLRWIEGNLYTGLLSGGVLSSTPGSTTFNLSSGSGLIVQLNASTGSADPYPTIQKVSWGNYTNQPITNSGSAKLTYISITSAGAINQQIVPIGSTDITQWDTQIEIGVVLHLSGSVSTGVYNAPQVSYGFAQRTDDFVRAFGPLKISGHTLQPSGSTLGLIKTSGTSYNNGSNYVNNPNHPSTVSDSAVTVSKIYRYYVSGSTPIIDTGTANAGYTAIDPSKYVNTSTGVLTAVPGGQYTIQRVFWIPNSPTNAFLVYYGNGTYNSADTAVAAIQTEVFTEAPNTSQNAILLGYVIVNGTETNLTNAVFVQGGLFRSVNGIGSSNAAPVSNTLAGLSDVSVGSRVTGDLLYYNGSQWVSSKQLSGSFGLTGSLNILGTVSASAFSGSHFGTSSWASNATTASYSLVATSASYASASTSASYATNALTASYALVAAAGGFPYTGSALITGSLSVTGAVNSTLGFTGSLLGTASYASNALTASYALVAAAGGFPYTGSALITGSLGVTGSVNSTLGFTGSLLGTASFATSASYASFATTASSAPGYTVSFTQSVAAATWSFVHNMNTRYPIVQVYGSDYKQVIPNDIVGVNVNTVEVRFDYAATGYAVMSNGGGLYVTGSTSLLNQTSAATTWSFTHNLNSKYVNFEIYDSDDYVLIPSAIRAIDVNTAEIHFAGSQTGKAVANFSGINGAPNATTASYALTATSASYATTASYLAPVTSGYVVLTQVSQSLNFADDTAAAAGGVPLGGLYRNGNFILIRIS